MIQNGTVKILITQTVYSFLEGSHLFQRADHPEEHGYGLAGQGLVRKYWAANRRKDGSRLVTLWDQEAQVLLDYAETMADGARDNCWEPWGRAELSAARAVIRKLSDAGIRPRPLSQGYATEARSVLEYDAAGEPLRWVDKDGGEWFRPPTSFVRS